MSDLLMIMDAKEVEGDSQVEGFEKKIDITHFFYSAYLRTDVTRGPGQGAPGSAQVSPIVITKKVCSATPKLEKQFFLGQPIPTVVLTVFKMNGKKIDRYQVVTLTNAYICSIQVSPEGLEEMSLSFDSVKREIYVQNTATSEMTQRGATTFNLKKVKAE